MRKWFKMCAAAGVISCSFAPPNPTLSDLGQLPSLDRGAMPHRDGGELRSAALDYYARGDYVRALRFGYWAAQTIPTDVRLRLLLGIVYDGGFDRPDLALPEYERALSLKPDRRFQDRLRRRIHYLNRRLLQDATKSNIIDHSGNPLSENWLAVYPLRIYGPKNPEAGLEFSLLDWVLPNIKRRSPGLHIDPFTSLIVAQVYREVATHPTASDFARWCGAGAILTGNLTDLGQNRLRLALVLLDASGQPIYTSSAFIIDTMDPESAHTAILEEAGAALGLLETSEKDTYTPISNPAALSLYAQGLGQYLVGQVGDAEMNIRDAILLNPGSEFLASRFTWAESDLLGGQEGAELLDDYHRLLNLPDPDRVVRERLMRGHSLGSPSMSGISGTEIEDPYKPPRPEISTP